MTIILSNEDAEEILAMPECIAALEQAYREQAHGSSISAISSETITPTKYPNTIYQLKLQAGATPSLGVSAVRLSSDIVAFENKRQVKKPLAPGNRYTGLVLLFSLDTGEPLAIFPDGVMQVMRVGATTALGAKYLARPNSKTVALIGAGWQATGQVMAIIATHKVDLIRCYSPTADKRKAFCEKMSKRAGVAIQAVDSPEKAVQGADIVLCATNASQHVFHRQWLEPGMHVSTIRGAELGAEMVQAVDVIAIHDRNLRGVSATARGVEMPETWHAIPGLSKVDEEAPTLAELIAAVAPGRSSDSQTSCFLNVRGIGLQFAAVGAAFYRKALSLGRGREIATEWLTEDVVP